MKSTDLVAFADKVESLITAAKDSVKAVNDAIEAAGKIETETELKLYLVAEIKKLEENMKPLEPRISKISGASAKLRAEATKKNMQELEKLREDTFATISHHQASKSLTGEEMFAELDTNKDGKIEESDFVKFFKTCVKKPAEEEEKKPAEFSEEDLTRLFAYLDGEDEGFIGKDQFLGMIKKFMKVVKAHVITDGQSIKSKIMRRLEEGEVVEVITFPTVEGKSDTLQVKRMRVKALQDDLDGWVTPVGNAGTVFLEEGGNVYKVVKETILTGAFVIGGESNMKDRKLKVGDDVEVREWARKEEASGLMRMKVRVKADGQVGWVTSVGNTGIQYLEMA